MTTNGLSTFCARAALVGAALAAWPWGVARAGEATESPLVYVSPQGKPDAKGSAAEPRDLQTVLNGPSWLKPGTVVQLLDGEYRGAFVHKAECSGTRERPLVFRPAKGARATIVGGLSLYGSHTRFVGLEVTNPNQVEAPSFLNFYGGDGTSLINLVIHDNGAWETGHNGIGCWSAATNSEVHGCLIYNCGRGTRERSPHAHGIYTQNNRGTGTKRIEDNIFFRGYAWGIHAYGSSRASVDDFVFRRNIVFCNGSYGAQVGGGSPSQNIVFEENCLYGNLSIACAMGYGADGSTGLSFRRNYVAGGPRPRLLLQLRGYRDGNVEDNTFCALEAGPLVGIQIPEGWNMPAYAWDRNRYFSAKSFSSLENEPATLAIVRGRMADFKEWQALKFDGKSTSNRGKPAENACFVMPSRHQPGRGHAAVYNWRGLPTVEMDLSGVLVKDKPFIVLDAQDYYGKPVLEGVWRGGPVSIPMPERAPSPEFAALVVLSGEAIDYSGRGAR